MNELHKLGIVCKIKKEIWGEANLRSVGNSSVSQTGDSGFKSRCWLDSGHPMHE